MLKFVLTLVCLIFAAPLWCVSVPSATTVPKLYYRIPKSKKLENKDYLTIKGKDFAILAKRIEEKGNHIYWKTIKIRVKNVQAIESWPYSIKQLMETLQAKSAKEPNFSLNAFASPISLAVLNNARNIYAGYNFKTLSSSKHELNHDLTVTENYQKDETFGFETSSLILNSSVVYDYNNFHGNWTYFVMGNYRRQKFNGQYPIKHQWGIGPAGLKYKFIKNGTYIKNLDLSYIPVYEKLTSDFNVAFPGQEASKTLVDIRNSFRLRFQAQYTDWTLSYVLFYRPAYYFKIKTLDMQDIDLNSTIIIGRNLTDKIQLLFTNTYTKDIRLFRANGMRADNTINSFSINLNTVF